MKSKCKQLAVSGLISVLSFFVFIGLVHLSFAIFVSNMFGQEYLSVRALNVIKFILSLFIFRSVSYIFCVGDNNVKKHYFESEINSFFITNLKHILTSGFFYVQTACVFILSLILPTSFTYDYVCKAFWHNTPTTATETKIRTLLIMLPLLFIITLLSYITAYRKFYRLKKKNDNRSDRAQIIKHLTLTLLVYCGVSMCIPWFLPFVITIWNLAKRYNITLCAVIFALVIIFIIVAYLLICFVRALLKRRVFIKNLVRLCKKDNIELSKIEKPYLSVIFQREGINFSVEKSGRKYDCKFISGVFYNSPIIFSDKGDGVCQHTLRIFKVELLHVRSRIDFAFEGDGEKILIVSPVPSNIYVSNENEKPRLADTGEVAGDYRIFTGTGFLNSLERDCIVNQ